MRNKNIFCRNIYKGLSSKILSGYLFAEDNYETIFSEFPFKNILKKNIFSRNIYETIFSEIIIKNILSKTIIVKNILVETILSERLFCGKIFEDLSIKDNLGHL